jgi:murein DD-endopeptidase MepM/ murein hydrolase activator NlpD
MFVALVFLTGCIGGLDTHGAKIKKMYADQITIDTVLPANAPSISQQFHRFENVLLNETRSEHLGIDIIAPKGTAVIAAAAGVVVQSNYHPMYGHTVEIDHGNDPKGRSVHTIYKHLTTRLPKPGDKIARGQKIGGLGRTGVLSSGILHLHFEVRRDEGARLPKAVDPGEFWFNGKGIVTCYNSHRNWPHDPLRFTYPVVCMGS